MTKLLIAGVLALSLNSCITPGGTVVNKSYFPDEVMEVEHRVQMGDRWEFITVPVTKAGGYFIVIRDGNGKLRTLEVDAETFAAANVGDYMNGYAN